MATDTTGLLATLRELEPALRRRYKAREMALFGSYARGEGTADSDVDVLVDFEEGADIFDLIGLTMALEEALSREVDVVPRTSLRREIRDEVLREAVAL